MKQICFITLLILMLITGLYIKVNCDFEDYKEKVAIENWEYEKRIQEMEKDIRILKTDSYLAKNGFEEK